MAQWNEIIIPTRDTKVEINGADARAGTKPAWISANGSSAPAIVPNITTPSSEMDSIAGRTFGRISRRMIRESFAPWARAAVTK